MKTKMTATLAVAVVAVMVFAAAGSTTYSWFSDSEESEVEVTTGKIAMSTEYSALFVQSYGGDPIELVSDGTVTTDLGGTVKYETSETSSSSIMSIQFNGMAPGDSVTFKITNTITNTINANYAGSYSIVEIPSTGSAIPLVVDMDDEVKNFSNLNSPNVVEDVITISMPQSVSEQQGKTYVIKFLFQAIQGNVAPDALRTEQVPSGQVSSITVAKASDSDDVAKTTVDFPAFDRDVSITAQALIDVPSTFTVRQGETVLGGVDVEIKNSVGDDIHTLTSPAMVTMKVLGYYTSENLAVYHEGGSIMNATFTVGTGVDAGYTIITFYAYEFSSYIAVKSPSVCIGDVNYFSLSHAVENAVAGDIITIYRNLVLTEPVYVKKDITIDGNGYTVTFDNDLTNSKINWGISMHAGALKDITIVGADKVSGVDGKTYGFRASGSNGSLVGDVSFDNVTLTGTYAFNFNAGGAANYSISFNDSFLNGWSSYGKGISAATFTDCEFAFNDRTGDSHYGYLRPYVDSTFTDCEFADGFTIDGREAKSNFVNCQFGEGLVVEGLIYIDGVAVAFTAEQFAEAIPTGYVVLMKDIAFGDVVYEITEDMTIDLNGFDMDFSNNLTRPFKVSSKATLTINAGESNVKCGKYGLVNMFGGSLFIEGGNFTGELPNGAFIRLSADEEIKITLKDVSFAATDVQSRVIGYGVYSNTQNSTINVIGGSYESGMGFIINKGTIDGATIKALSSANGYPAVYVAGEGVIIKDCTVTSNLHAISVAGGFTVTVKNCVVTAKQLAFQVYSSGGIFDIHGGSYSGTTGHDDKGYGSTGPMDTGCSAKFYFDGNLVFTK